jgi:hypothetical protein
MTRSVAVAVRERAGGICTRRVHETGAVWANQEIYRTRTPRIGASGPHCQAAVDPRSAATPRNEARSAEVRTAGAVAAHHGDRDGCVELKSDPLEPLKERLMRSVAMSEGADP